MLVLEEIEALIVILF